MTPIKRKLLYIFRDTLLRLRISWAGQQLTLSVGYHVDRADAKGKPKWDGSRCIRNTTHGSDKVPAAAINRVLEQLEERVNNAFYSFESADKIPDKMELRAIIVPDSNKCEESRSIASLSKIFLTETSRAKQWMPRTYRIAKQSLDALIDALGGDITVDSIKETEMAKLMEYLSTQKPALQRIGSTKENCQSGLTNGTINIYMSFIHQFARWTEERGMAKKNCILGRKTKSLKVATIPVVYLTMDEIKRFRSVPLTPKKQEVADTFIFCCFTGLRYSDVKDLRWAQVEADSISIVTQKTHDTLTIELNKFSKSILERRVRGKDADNVFNVPSNYTYNKITKEIAKAAGIDDPVKTTSYQGSVRKDIISPKWQYITSHTPRKTFVTNILSLGVSPMVVMKWTGHKNYEAMKPYIDIISTAKKESMAYFDKIDEVENDNKIQIEPSKI